LLQFLAHVVGDNCSLIFLPDVGNRTYAIRVEVCLSLGRYQAIVFIFSGTVLCQNGDAAVTPRNIWLYLAGSVVAQQSYLHLLISSATKTCDVSELRQRLLNARRSIERHTILARPLTCGVHHGSKSRSLQV